MANEPDRSVAGEEAALSLYREIFRHASDGITILDGQGRFVAQNAANERVLGYSDRELLGKTPSIYLEPGVFPHVQESVRASGSYRIETRARAKDGSIRIIDLSAFALRDATGQLLYFVGIKRDVTEERKLFDELRESEARFRQMAENINEAFWMCDEPPTQILYVSPAYGRLWGRSAETFYSDPYAWKSAIHPDDRAAVERAITTQASGRYDQEYRIVRPDGTVRWIRDRAFPIRDASGRVHRLAGIAEDITERKRVEHDLRLLANIVSMSVDAISTGVQDGTITSWNRAAEEIFGYTAEEVVGKDVRKLLIPPERMNEARLTLEQDPRAVVRMRTERLHKSGRRVPVMMTTFPLVDKKGNVYARAGIHADLTHVAEIERKLVEQSRMAAVGEMAAGIAHEIRNPLFGISSAAQILAREAQGNPEVREIADSMLGEIDRLNKMLRNLLLYAKPGTLRTAAVRPLDLFEEFRQLHAGLLESNELRLQITAEPREATVRVDPDQIRQVILNLGLNAIQAAAPETEIEIRSELTSGGGWRFDVHNQGEPIPPDVIPLIFEPFFSRKPEGSGLGLAVARKIVDDHGGTIRCESSPQLGTTFTVWIPPGTPLDGGGGSGKKEAPP